MPIQPAAKLTQIPPFPALSDRAAGIYNTKAYAFGVHMGGTDAATPGLFVAEINALADNVAHNAQEAEHAATTSRDAANTATTQADAALGYRNAAQAAAATATTKAGEASASAIAASQLNLGDKASPPTTDNQGQPLRAGATYYDTTLGKWRVWTGTGWGDGISALAGVSSLNGLTGALNLTTLDAYGITDAAKRLTAEVKTAAFTAVDGCVYACDTSGGAFTATLPASPQPGWTVTFIDYASTFDAANLTVARNGSNIFGLADNYVLDQKNRGRTFVYVNSTKGWMIYA